MLISYGKGRNVRRPKNTSKTTQPARGRLGRSKSDLWDRMRRTRCHARIGSISGGSTSYSPGCYKKLYDSGLLSWCDDDFTILGLISSTLIQAQTAVTKCRLFSRRSVSICKHMLELFSPTLSPEHKGSTCDNALRCVALRFLALRKRRTRLLVANRSRGWISLYDCNCRRSLLLMLSCE